MESAVERLADLEQQLRELMKAIEDGRHGTGQGPDPAGAPDDGTDGAEK
jgi:hypothetical protein